MLRSPKFGNSTSAQSEVDSTLDGKGVVAERKALQASLELKWVVEIVGD